MGTYETNLGAKLTSTTTAGYQYQFLRSDFTGQEGRDLAPLIQNISAASNLFTLPVQYYFQTVRQRILPAGNVSVTTKCCT
jgi:hypothetical protein